MRKYKTLPMDKSWRRNLLDSGMWWYQENTPHPTGRKEEEAIAKAFRLRDRLLSYGGNLAVLALYDPDIDALLDHGVIRGGRNAILHRMQPNQCHANSAELWTVYPELMRIATGYALSKDGGWRQHSWIVRADGQVIETTVKRIAYFGITFNDKECREFAERNC